MKKIYTKQRLNFISKAEETTKARTLVVKISTPTPDRSKDTVNPMGADFTNFLKNPVVLFGHDYKSIPVAKCTSIKATDTGIIASLEFPDEGKNPNADVVYQMNVDGFLNAWSIGFMPKNYDANMEGGLDFKEWELLEFSSVPVPDNPEALTIMRSKGLDVDEILGDEKEQKEAEIERKASDEETDNGSYSADMLVGELKVAQLTDLLQNVFGLADNDSVDNWTDPDAKASEGISTKDVQKSGRAISAKHEELLKAANDHMQKSMDNVNSVLGSIESDSDSSDDGDLGGDDEKSVSSSTLLSLQKALREQDRSIGKTLRQLKSALDVKGGEK